MNLYPEIPLKLYCADSEFPQKLRSIAPVSPEIISRTLEVQNLDGDGVDIHFSLPLDRAIELLGRNLGVDFRAEDWTGPEPEFLVEVTLPLPLLHQVLDLVFSSNGRSHFVDSSGSLVHLTATMNLRLVLAMAICQQNHNYTIALAQEKRGSEPSLSNSIY